MPKRHNAKLCPFAIRQRIINALANGDSIRAIARALHVSNNTVAAIREQEWQQVAARKERIAAQCELNATLAAERMTDKLRGTDDIPLNTLVPAFGVSVDKLAVLRGHAPSVNIANIVLPTEEERAERRALHDKLDEITQRLRDATQRIALIAPRSKRSTTHNLSVAFPVFKTDLTDAGWRDA